MSSSSTRIGELATIYQLATVAFVGGSLVATGGHNILEPAVFGKPIVFGPHMSNFAEIAAAFVANVRGGAGARASASWTTCMMALMTDPVRRARLGAAARALVEANRGAKDKSLAVLSALAAAGSDDDVSRQRPAVQTHCLISFTRRPPARAGAGSSAIPTARRRLSSPVISVGNLSVGGTGKTPLVARDRRAG